MDSWNASGPKRGKMGLFLETHNGKLELAAGTAYQPLTDDHLCGGCKGIFSVDKPPIPTAPTAYMLTFFRLHVSRRRSCTPPWQSWTCVAHLHYLKNQRQHVLRDAPDCSLALAESKRSLHAPSCLVALCIMTMTA